MFVCRVVQIVQTWSLWPSVLSKNLFIFAMTLLFKMTELVVPHLFCIYISCYQICGTVKK